MKLRPIHDVVIVTRVNEDSRIITPDTARKPTKGRVVAVGEGNLMNDGRITPLVVKVGDRVVFSEHAGVEQKIEGKDYLILREHEILTILEDEDLAELERIANLPIMDGIVASGKGE